MKRFALAAALAVAIFAMPAVAASRPPTPHISVGRLRGGIAWHRSKTWQLQSSVGLPRTPSRRVERRTRSTAYLHWLLRLWKHRHVQARRLVRSSTVPQIICRVFTGPETCSTALTIAKRESGYDITAWNASDHGGLFQLGTGERKAYATIGYSTAYEQTVAAHNLYLARGWEPWTCCEG